MYKIILKAQKEASPELNQLQTDQKSEIIISETIKEYIIRELFDFLETKAYFHSVKQFDHTIDFHIWSESYKLLGKNAAVVRNLALIKLPMED